ncbi:pyridoxine 5'-phosphate oxidase C-terminal domain-containing protein, partial [Pseudomonas aeruginosa]|uniref:pyridoxine 5'-phosphate oxidase C-terminal domain-containing protein n=1 Tax=Pseudomonas aeruginosa TaxID=287 RepID=UPI00244DCD5A
TPTPSRTPTKKSCGRCRNSSTKRETSHVDRLTEISGFPAYNPLFELCLESVEFWGNGTERLHERLRYDRDEGGWKHRYLQP